MVVLAPLMWVVRCAVDVSSAVLGRCAAHVLVVEVVCFCAGNIVCLGCESAYYYSCALYGTGSLCFVSADCSLCAHSGCCVCCVHFSLITCTVSHQWHRSHHPPLLLSSSVNTIERVRLDRLPQHITQHFACTIAEVVPFQFYRIQQYQLPNGAERVHSAHSDSEEE